MIKDEPEPPEPATPIGRRESRHAGRLQEMFDIKRGVKEKHRRGSHWQQDKLIMERSIRIQSLIFDRWAAPMGMTQADAARKLGLRPGTLSHWKADWKANRLHPVSRGRPVDRAAAAIRNEVLAVMGLTGPGVSVAWLMDLFPDMARREIEDLVSRCRSIYRKRKAMLVHALRWPRTGAVWAMDFTDAPLPIDGIFKHILVVRDLASGEMLWSQPVVSEDHSNALEALKALFLWWGPPLVVKADNGSGFIDQAVKDLLRKNDVLLLLSPPETPRYNGACEAGIGGLKIHAHIESARHDRPGEWTCDDIETARLMANETAHPRGLDESTPDVAWASRLPITRAERVSFLESYVQLEAEEVANRGFLSGIELSPANRAAIDRFAIARACVAQGLLYFRRRRVSLRIKSRFWRKISS